MDNQWSIDRIIALIAAIGTLLGGIAKIAPAIYKFIKSFLKEPPIPGTEGKKEERIITIGNIFAVVAIIVSALLFGYVKNRLPTNPPSQPTLVAGLEATLTLTNTLQPTATPTPPPLTLTPSLPTSTNTPTLTPMPVAGEFELDTEGWGERNENDQLIPGERVSKKCGGVFHAGNCSLEYALSAKLENRKFADKFVARRGTPDDTDSSIRLLVYIPTNMCIKTDCSTARVYIKDKDDRTYEGGKDDFIKLNRPNEWQEIKLDLHGTDFTGPYNEIGIHFYMVIDYEGPVYLDSVTIEH